MKRTLIAAAIAAMSIPVGFAAPAMADDLLGSNPATWTPTNVPPTVPGPVGAPNPDPGLIGVFDGPEGSVGLYNPMSDAGQFDGPEGSVGFQFTTGPDGCSTFDVGHISCTSPYAGNITFTLPVPLGPETVTNALNVNVDFSKNLAPGIELPSTRSKTTDGYTIRNSKRITAMARHFVNNHGDVINIHTYGPDREIALTKGHLVREQLQDEITRLGGNRSAHLAAVTYAGDSDDKKGVDVTIHQHAGSRHTKAHAWASTHLASKSSTLTDAHRETVTAHLVASSTPEQVQATWDIDMNEDVSLVDPAQITEIARYFLDHPDQHILIRDHVGADVHGSTVADAVLAEMARLAAEDGMVTTRDGFMDWLNQVVVSVNSFTEDLNAAEVEIHAVTVALDDAATSIANVITDTTTLVGDLITDVETVINPIVTAVDDGAVIVKTVKDVITAVALF